MKATKPRETKSYRVVQFIGDDMWTVLETTEKAVAWSSSEMSAKQMAHTLKRDTGS